MIRVATVRAVNGFLLGSRYLAAALRVRTPPIALLIIVLCSSCGSSVSASGSSAPANPGVPEASSPAPSTGIIGVPQGYVARVFTRPSLASHVVATLRPRTVVQIICRIRGERVSDKSGATSDLWYLATYGDLGGRGYLPNIILKDLTIQLPVPACK
jgi:hypothetical protein